MDFPGADLLMGLVAKLEAAGKARMTEKRAAMLDRSVTEQQLGSFGVPYEEPKGHTD
jgi:hypothetical protein